MFVQFEDEWPLMAYIRRWSFWRSRAASKFKEELVGSVFDPCSEENLDTDGQQPNEICDIAGSSTEQSLQMSLPSQTPGSVSGSTRLSSNIGVLATSHALGTDQIFIPRPTNEDELRNIAKTTLEHLREAMKFETRPFASLKVRWSLPLRTVCMTYIRSECPTMPCFEVLGHGFSALTTDTRTMGCIQSRGIQIACPIEHPLKDLQASRLEPLLSSQYEGAWPLSVYTDRYLERRIMKRKQRNTNEYMPSLGVTDMEEVKYSPDALTATPSVQNRTVSLISSKESIETHSSALCSLREVYEGYKVTPLYLRPIFPPFRRSLRPRLFLRFHPHSCPLCHQHSGQPSEIP